MNPDNPLAPSFPRRRESSNKNSPQCGQNLDDELLRGDCCELGKRPSIPANLGSTNWIPAYAGMTSFGVNGLVGLKSPLLSSVFRKCMLLLLCGLSVALNIAESLAAEPAVILFIGDSHSVGSFGIQQDALLRNVPGFRVATYAVCGSSPLSWLEGEKTRCGYFFKDSKGREQRGLEADTPLLANLLKTHQPRYTVVELGANMYGGSAEWMEATAHDMAMAIVNSGSKCIWIGPPQARIQPELGRVFNALNKAVGQYCLLFDSRKFTAYPAAGGDGIHFDSLGESGQRVAEQWALQAYYAFSPVLEVAKPQRKPEAH